MRFFKIKYLLLALTISAIAYLAFLPTSSYSTLKSIDSDTSLANLYFQKANALVKQTSYDSALDLFNKAGLIYEKEHFWDNYIQSLIKIGTIYRVKGDLSKAQEYTDLSELKAQEYLNKNNAVFNEIYLLKATILGIKGNFNLSIEIINKALNNPSLKKNDTNTTKFYNALGNNYYFLGKYNDALNYYNKALQLASIKKNKVNPEVALYNNNIGNIYAIKGAFDKAILYFELAISTYEKTLSNDDPQLALAYSNLGVFYYVNGQLDRAMNYFNKSIEIYKVKFGKDYAEIGRTYITIASIYSNKGDYDKALQYYTNALTILSKYLNPNHPLISTLYINIGALYTNKKEFTEALLYYKKSIAIKGHPSSIVNTLAYIADCYYNLNDIKEANNYYKFAIEKAKKELGGNHFVLGEVYLSYGQFCLQIKQFKSALLYFDNSFKIFNKNFGNKNPQVANVYNSIGDWYYTQSDYRKALSYYQKAIIANVTNFNDSNYYNNPDFKNVLLDIYLSESLTKKAKALYKYYFTTNNINNLQASLKTYELNIQLIDKIRSSYETQEAKLFLTNNVKEIFNNTIKTALALYKKTQNPAFEQAAFKYAEASKGAVLRSSMQDVEAINFGGVPSSIQEKEKDLKANISLYNKNIYEEKLKANPDQEKLKLWQRKQFELDEQYSKLIQTLEKEFPSYFALKYKDNTLGVKETQNNIKNNEAFVEYTVSDSTLFTFVITKDKFSTFSQPIDTTFAYYISNVRGSYNIGRISSQTLEDYKINMLASYNLYKLLIGPIESITKGKKLIIVPDDKLGYIPFEALLTRMPDVSRMNYRDLPYLIRDYLISYSYSATLLYNEHLSSKPRHNKLLAFAPTYDNIKSIHSNELLAARNLKDVLVPIPGVKEEIGNIRKSVRAKIFEEYDATEKNFKANAKNYEILHLAMHTLIDDKNPMYSQLIFTLNNDSIDDGFLNTYEIYNMELNARLAVLSACNTGDGKLQKGEGIMSLARGFIYAGVPSILMTLWSVEDKSGAQLMGDFYKYLKAGMSTDEALRQAKLDYLQNADQLTSHPYFWAAYVNIGNTEPINMRNYWPYFTIPGALFLTLLVVWLMRKKALSRRGL